MTKQRWTAKRIIDEAAKLGGWGLTREGCIRRGETREECPITALCQLQSIYYAEAAYKLGMSIGLAYDIAVAADDVSLPPNRAALRRRMLAAFGLKEARR